MKPKTIVTVVLLLFVAASVVTLVVKESGAPPVQNAPGPTAQNSPDLPDEAEAARVVVYYFHGSVRCATCRTIESQAKEAVQTGFADALQDGRLEWRVVNIEDAGNEHFVQDFQLSTRSVVLERIGDGERQEWKNLDRVWDLVRGDKKDFLTYIQDETKTYMEASAK